VKRRVWCARHQRWHSEHAATHCRGEACHRGTACSLAERADFPYTAAQLVEAKAVFDATA
jgi:hypothetical protein